MNTLVIGAAGGFGGTVARELESRGHVVRALVRPGGRAPRLSRATLVTGDARSVSDVERAARGVDVIVWGFHLPYQEWVPGALEAARATAEAAVTHRCTVLFPGNLYGLGSGFQEPADETAPLNARSRLGKIRNEIEEIFRDAARRGARVVIVRAGDYLGPDAANTWFETMSVRALRGGAIIDPGPQGVPHAWAYLPDVARAGVDLLEQRGALDPYAVFHFAGFDVDSSGMVDAIRRGLGDPKRGTWRAPWWLVRAASPFSLMLRLALEVHYLWDEPVLLNGAKLRRTLPAFRATSLDEAVRLTLDAIATRRNIPRPARALGKADRKSPMLQA